MALFINMHRFISISSNFIGPMWVMPLKWIVFAIFSPSRSSSSPSPNSSSSSSPSSPSISSSSSSSPSPSPSTSSSSLCASSSPPPPFSSFRAFFAASVCFSYEIKPYYKRAYFIASFTAIIDLDELLSWTNYLTLFNQSLLYARVYLL